MGFLTHYGSSDISPVVVDSAVKTGIQFNNQSVLIALGIIVILFVVIFAKIKKKK